MRDCAVRLKPFGLLKEIANLNEEASIPEGHERESQ